VYNTLYDLKEFTDPKNYKTYEELKVKLANVLGEAMPRTTQQTVALDETAPAPQPKAAESVDNDDEDTMSYFARLAAED